MRRSSLLVLTPKPLGSIRPSLALVADPVVAPPSRDDGHAPSLLLGLGRDCGAIIRSIQVVSAFVLVLSGCATTPVPSAAPSWKLLSATPDVTELQFQTTDNLNRATVTDAGARGPFVNLKRSEGTLQGTVRVDWPVELRRGDRPNQIIGRFAGDAFDLTVMPDGEEFRAQGFIRGDPTTFWLSPRRMRGSVGSCRFDLVWGSGRYTGSRTCGPLSEESLSVLVPASLASWSDPEAAALLAMMAPRQ